MRTGCLPTDAGAGTIRLSQGIFQTRCNAHSWDRDRPSEGDAFVRAETINQAVALIGHPEVNVYALPADAVWPGDPGEAVWQCG